MKDRKKYECNRCGYEWFGSAEKPPVTCPSCRSPYYNRERVYKKKEE